MQIYSKINMQIEIKMKTQTHKFISADRHRYINAYGHIHLVNQNGTMRQKLQNTKYVPEE
jgi:hypothetical protein